MPLVEELYAELQEAKAALAERDKELRERDEKIAQLTAQIAHLRRQIFGTGRSEKMDERQLALMLGTLESLEQAKEELVKVPAHERKKRRNLPPRDEQYEHLPIEESVEIIPNEVKADPESYERINSEERTWEVDYHPPKFFRREIIRPKFRHKADRSLPPLIAPAPSRVVEGIASANLLAMIMVGKFVDHLPLTRQVKQYKRHGCVFAIASMIRWVEKTAAWLKPIYNYMSWQLLQGNYLQADDTPVTFCDPDLGLKKSKKGYFCGYSRPGSDVVYVWRRGRTHADMTAHLEGFKGILQTDAYAPYIRFAKDNDAVTLLGCFAHARRKFTDAASERPREVALVIKLIKKLYAAEKEIRQSDPAMKAEEILKLRKDRCTNTLKRLKRLLLVLQSRTRPKTNLGIAVYYALNQWDLLCEYINHGQAHIDNNLMENAIRPTAVGKKNWMFIGHPNAGERAAVIYSILISCQRHGVEPLAYLRYVLNQNIPAMTREQLAKMTPEAFARQPDDQQG